MVSLKSVALLAKRLVSFHIFADTQLHELFINKVRQLLRPVPHCQSKLPIKRTGTLNILCSILRRGTRTKYPARLSEFRVKVQNH